MRNKVHVTVLLCLQQALILLQSTAGRWRRLLGAAGFCQPDYSLCSWWGYPLNNCCECWNWLKVFKRIFFLQSMSQLQAVNTCIYWPQDNLLCLVKMQIHRRTYTMWVYHACVYFWIEGTVLYCESLPTKSRAVIFQQQTLRVERKCAVRFNYRKNQNVNVFALSKKEIYSWWKCQVGKIDLKWKRDKEPVFFRSRP